MLEHVLHVNAAMTGESCRAQLRTKQCLLCVKAVLYADERTCRLVSNEEDLFVTQGASQSMNPCKTGGQARGLCRCECNVLSYLSNLSYRSKFWDADACCKWA